MMLKKNPLEIFNVATFLQTQILMLPVLLLFYQENGLTAGDLFLFQGIFSITALLVEVPAGYIGDIFPRRNILILSYCFFLCRLVLWLCIGFFTDKYWVVLIGEILYSFSKAFYSGVADGYVYDYLKSQHKTHQMLKGYGKLNFCMSVGTACAALIGPKLYKDYGFSVLIIIEMILNSTAIGLLFLLPKVPSARQRVKGLCEKYKELFSIAKQTFLNASLFWYIIYSGILAATTLIFVWSFQPMMQLMGVPSEYYGVVYFVNHGVRALASLLLPITLTVISLKKLAPITYVLFCLAFIAGTVIVQTADIAIGVPLMGFICIVIGVQLTFTLGNISRLHSLISSDVRSTTASVNYLVSRLLAGILLIVFKFILDDVRLEKSFLIYLGLFGLSIIPLFFLMRLPPVKKHVKK
ncbi:MAG: MFS transporter [Alphaproteobacteria bacterium]|nr:MFS transporter [Alphaproteobacteria bacterium]